MEIYTPCIYICQMHTVNLHFCMDLMFIPAFHLLHSFKLFSDVLFSYQMSIPDFMKISSGILKLLHTYRWTSQVMTSSVIAENPPPTSQV
jgi:hypothetical protein